MPRSGYRVFLFDSLPPLSHLLVYVSIHNPRMALRSRKMKPGSLFIAKIACGVAVGDLAAMVLETKETAVNAQQRRTKYSGNLLQGLRWLLV